MAAYIPDAVHVLDALPYIDFQYNDSRIKEEVESLVHEEMTKSTKTPQEYLNALNLPQLHSAGTVRSFLVPSRVTWLILLNDISVHFFLSVCRCDLALPASSHCLPLFAACVKLSCIDFLSHRALGFLWSLSASPIISNKHLLTQTATR
jgi:hypothetical protein